MKTRGKMVDIHPLFRTKLLAITFEAEGDPAIIEQELGKDLDITFSQHREKRSLDANAYFHVLCDKIRQKLGISMARAKNTLIGRYGQIEYIDDQPVVIKTNLPVEAIMEQETLHCEPCGVEVQNGREINYYRVYRGSHTYNTKEMSQLIDGTIVEAKELGIETATPDELRRMMATWERNHGPEENGQGSAK